MRKEWRKTCSPTALHSTTDVRESVTRKRVENIAKEIAINRVTRVNFLFAWINVSFFFFFTPFNSFPRRVERGTVSKSNYGGGRGEERLWKATTPRTTIIKQREVGNNSCDRGNTTLSRRFFPPDTLSFDHYPATEARSGRDFSPPIRNFLSLPILYSKSFSPKFLASYFTVTPSMNIDRWADLC